jgi:hypothetical protein
MVKIKLYQFINSILFYLNKNKKNISKNKDKKKLKEKIN